MFPSRKLFLLHFSFIVICLISLSNYEKCDALGNSKETVQEKPVDPNDEYRIKSNTNDMLSANDALNRTYDTQRATGFSDAGTLNSGQTKRKASRKNNEELIVNTGSGYVRGRSFFLDHHIPKYVRNKNYHLRRKKYRVDAWLGIPFAEKPIGDLKFKRPVPINKWDGILDATELPNSCFQLNDTVIPGFPGVEMWNPNTKVSEDCLYLNIWAPHPVPKNSPVLVKYKTQLLMKRSLF